MGYTRTTDSPRAVDQPVRHTGHTKNEPLCVSQSPSHIDPCDLTRYRAHPSALKI
jgi:hypothetical protein